jgi:hypothetical protein
MISNKKQLLCLALMSILLTSCGTIFGGSNYVAHVTVVDNPNANVIYKGKDLGKGQAKFKVPRNEANKFVFFVKEEGCQEQAFRYIDRTFRGWAFAGSLISFTSYFIPFGVGIDFATGSYWKPDIFEKGVSKIDYKNYTYNVYYSECKKPIPFSSTETVVSHASPQTETVVQEKAPVQVKPVKTEPEVVETVEVKPVGRLIDVIYLKNGSVIKGDIIEYATDGFVKIKLSDENIYNFSSSQIIKITREFH